MLRRKTRTDIVREAAYEVMKKDFASQVRGKITEEIAMSYLIGYGIKKRGG